MSNKDWKTARPQNQNLKPLNERSPEEAQAIRSAGGKACAEKNKQKKMMRELLQMYSELPISDARRKNRLKRMGITEDEDLTQKMLVADALMRAAQAGNTYAIQTYLDLIGEAETGGPVKENNLLDAIIDSTKEDLDTDDLSEIQQEATADPDMVESPSV